MDANRAPSHCNCVCNPDNVSACSCSCHKASPFARFVSVGELCSALETSRSSLLRAIVAGRIPDGDREGPRAERRWPVATAAEIVTRSGRVPPAAWLPAGDRAALAVEGRGGLDAVDRDHGAAVLHDDARGAP